MSAPRAAHRGKHAHTDHLERRLRAAVSRPFKPVGVYRILDQCDPGPFRMCPTEQDQPFEDLFYAGRGLVREEVDLSAVHPLDSESV
jgi:hypothetical protein